MGLTIRSVYYLGLTIRLTLATKVVTPARGCLDLSSAVCHARVLLHWSDCCNQAGGPAERGVCMLHKVATTLITPAGSFLKPLVVNHVSMLGVNLGAPHRC